jgi:hypothetical protein
MDYTPLLKEYYIYIICAGNKKNAIRMAKRNCKTYLEKKDTVIAAKNTGASAF